MGYAWIVDRDYLAGPGDPSRVGTAGPRRATDEQLRRLEAGEGVKWHTRDDDGHMVYSGRFLGDHESEDGFGPLDDFAKPDAGATSIQYWYENSGRWVTL